MATERKIRPVEKRYVPQQESYRNLPTPTPQAESVRVIAQGEAISPAAAKLRSLAEGLSSLNKGLVDYLTLEKSYEETNRAEAEARARAGLDMQDGHGFMNYGVIKGYIQGQALNDYDKIEGIATSSLDAIKDSLTFENYRSEDDVGRTTDALIDDAIRASGVNLNEADPLYISKIGNKLAELKLAARINAKKMYADNVGRLNVNNYTTHVDTVFKEKIIPQLSIIANTPEALTDQTSYQQIRDWVSTMTKTAETDFYISREAANVLVVDTVTSAIRQMVIDAVDTGDRSPEMLADISSVATGLLKSVRLPDTAGGVKLVASTGSPDLRRAIGALTELTAGLSDADDKAREAVQKKQVETLAADMSLALLNGASFEDVREQFRNLEGRGLSNSQLKSAILDVNQFYRSQAAGPVEPEYLYTEGDYLDYMSLVLTEDISLLDIHKLALDHKLPRDLLVMMVEGYNARMTTKKIAEDAIEESTKKITGRYSDANHNRQFNTQNLRLAMAELNLSDAEAEYVANVGAVISNELRKELPMEYIQKFVQDASATWRSVDSQFARKQFDLDSKGRKIDKQQYPGLYAAHQEAKQLLDAQKARKLYPYNSSKERDSRKYLEELEAVLMAREAAKRKAANKAKENKEAWQNQNLIVNPSSEPAMTITSPLQSQSRTKPSR